MLRYIANAKTRCLITVLIRRLKRKTNDSLFDRYQKIIAAFDLAVFKPDDVELISCC